MSPRTCLSLPILAWWFYATLWPCCDFVVHCTQPRPLRKSPVSLKGIFIRRHVSTLGKCCSNSLGCRPRSRRPPLPRLGQEARDPAGVERRERKAGTCDDSRSYHSSLHWVLSLLQRAGVCETPYLKSMSAKVYMYDRMTNPVRMICSWSTWRLWSVRMRTISSLSRAATPPRRSTRGSCAPLRARQCTIRTRGWVEWSAHYS